MLEHQAFVIQGCGATGQKDGKRMSGHHSTRYSQAHHVPPTDKRVSALL
jgi:hypothetical protein